MEITNNVNVYTVGKIEEETPDGRLKGHCCNCGTRQEFDPALAGKEERCECCRAVLYYAPWFLY